MIIIFFIDTQGINAYEGNAFSNIDDAEIFYKGNFIDKEYEEADNIINLDTSIFVVYDNLEVECYDWDNFNWTDDTSNKYIFDHIRRTNLTS